MPKKKKKTAGSKARPKRPNVMDGIAPELLAQFPELEQLAENSPPGAVVIGGMVVGFVRAHLDLLAKQVKALERIADRLDDQANNHQTEH